MTKKARGSAPVHRAARPATLADVVIALKRANGLPATRVRDSVDGLARSAPLAATTRCVAYQRLTCDDDHEVWLLSWLPGQRTGFHDHGESVGAFTVARTMLFELSRISILPAAPTTPCVLTATCS